MQLNLTNILFVIIFFNMLAVAAVAFFNKRGNALSNRLFSSFLFFKVICYSTDFFYLNYQYAIEHFIHVFVAGQSFDLLLGPIMLFYVRSIIYKDFQLRSKHLLHLIPFIVHVLYLVVVFISKSADDKRILLNEYSIYTLSYLVINNVLIYLSFVLYIISIAFELFGFKKKLKNNYANIEGMQVNWLLFLLISLAVIWLTAVVAGVSWIVGVNMHIPMEFFLISIFVFTNIIFFYGLVYSANFSGVEEMAKDKKNKKLLVDDKANAILTRLLAHVEETKSYTNPDLNINKLAEEINIPAYQISHVLNTKLNKNFFEFISYYRIKESTEKLSKKDNRTVLEILYEVGFNSKSAFNNAFKKHLGVTPTEFRKSASYTVLEPLLKAN